MPMTTNTKSKMPLRNTVRCSAGLGQYGAAPYCPRPCNLDLVKLRYSIDVARPGPPTGTAVDQPQGNLLFAERPHTRNRLVSLVHWLVTFILCLPVFAQYAIDWYSIDGGGGMSTGGVYTVTGTIGQPDVGPAMSGKQYSVIGGFWSLVAVVETSGAPYLTVSLATTGTVMIAWPVSPEGWVLQASPDLSQGGTWVNLPLTSPTNGLYIQLIDPTPMGSMFYRLHKP